MTELDTNPEVEAEDFIEELSDEVLDRTEVRFCTQFCVHLASD